MVWFFRRSAELFAFPLGGMALTLGAFYFVSGRDILFFRIALAGWSYALLFLGFDCGVSLILGKTGDTFRYVNPLYASGPAIAVRGETYPCGNYWPRVVGKLGILIVVGVIPALAFWSSSP